MDEVIKIRTPKTPKTPKPQNCRNHERHERHENCEITKRRNVLEMGRVSFVKQLSSVSK
jgi:hypothetical protein